MLEIYWFNIIQWKGLLYNMQKEIVSKLVMIYIELD